MNVKYAELEEQARELSERIEELEKRYSEAEEPVELAKLESLISRLEKRKNRIEDRMEKTKPAAEEEEEEEEETAATEGSLTGGQKEQLDENQREICFQCGGNLEFLGADKDTGNDLYRCDKCGGQYIDE